MSIDFPVLFTKMNGAGNDFIIIDHRQPFLSKTQKIRLAKALCRRGFSVGADGLMFIEQSERADFSWDFYNADGSVAEMCGNGARCAARYAYRHRIADKQLSFETLAGTIAAEVFDDGSVELNMTEPFGFKQGKPVNLDGKLYDVWCVNTGVPHAVIFVDNEDIPVEIWGRQVREDEQFFPQGTNVNFVSPRADGSFRTRTYERGVEEETRACGTGAVASALYAAITRQTAPPVEIITSGKDRLYIAFQLTEEPGGAERVTMKGSARFVYEGKITEEALL